MSTAPDHAKSIFLDALEIASAEARRTYLDDECGNNLALRAEVEELLRHNEQFPPSEGPAVVAGTLDMPAEPPIGEKPGTQIGPYKLLQQIGEGGMGAVFMAEQTHPVQRKVALKLIRPGLDNRQVIARFEAERQALALMDHPHIARVLDAGTTVSGQPYFVMELVHGVTITKYCDEHRLTPRQRLELFVPVCQAIQHAHQKGIIHRDIKPSNVMVTLYDGKPVPKVIDFGVAKAVGQKLTDSTMFTELGSIVGTLEYMSPEQAEQNQFDIDTRSDIYSLGVLLYELLTGTTPLDKKHLRGAAILEMLRIIKEDEPQRPSMRLSTTDELPSIAANRSLEPKKLSGLVRGELDWIVMKALEKDRNHRYETANGFAADVQRYLADEPVQACPPSAAYRFRKFARRNKGGLAVAALVLFFLILLGSGVGWAVRDRAARQANVAGQVESILAEADRLEGEEKWPEALAAARRAEAAAAGGQADAATAQRVCARLKDLDFIDRLERIRMQRELDHARTDREYARAFREHGVDVDELAVATSIDRLKVRPALAIPLATALDEWVSARRRVSTVEEAAWKRLVAVARGIDPEPMRDRIRETRGQPVAEVQDELRRLVASIDIEKQHPATLTLLSRIEGVRYSEVALRLLRDAQHLYPGDFRLNFELAATLDRHQDHEGAIRFYTAAVSIRPNSALPHTNLASALNSQNRRDEAIRHCRKAIELDPKLAEPHAILGSALANQKKYDDAIAAHRKAIELNPRLAAAHSNLGHALHAQNKFDEAIACYRKAIELDPNDADFHNNLGNTLRDQKKLDEAIAAYRKAIEIDPQYAPVHYNLGVALHHQKKLDEAIAAYRKAIEILPNYADAHGGLGGALAEQKKWPAAGAAFRRQVELDPFNVIAYGNLGAALSNQEKLAEAIAVYHTAVALAPKYADAHFNLGAALARQGKVDDDIAEFREAIALKPDDASARDLAAQHLNYAAWILATHAEPARRDPSRAVRLAEEAIRLKPQDGASHNTLGAALYRAGRWKEAVATLERSIELRTGGDSLDWFFLAMAHRQLGEKDKAREWYDRAVAWMDKNQPNNVELRRFRAEAEELLLLEKQGGTSGSQAAPAHPVELNF